MNTDYLKVANEPGLWIISIVIILIVLFQSFKFLHTAFVVGKKIGITDKQFKSAIRAGTISAIGPSLGILIGLVALIAIIGTPVAWLRLSIIGAVWYEAMAAQFGAQALGTTIGSPDYGLVGFANSLWTISLGLIGTLIFVGLFTHRLGGLRDKIVKGNSKLLPIISIGAFLGAVSFQCFKAAIPLGKGTLAVLVGALTMTILVKFSEKFNKSWIKEWALGIALVAGMFSTMLI